MLLMMGPLFMKILEVLKIYTRPTLWLLSLTYLEVLIYTSPMLWRLFMVNVEVLKINAMLTLWFLPVLYRCWWTSLLMRDGGVRTMS